MFLPFPFLSLSDGWNVDVVGKAISAKEIKAKNREAARQRELRSLAVQTHWPFSPGLVASCSLYMRYKFVLVSVTVILGCYHLQLNLIVNNMLRNRKMGKYINIQLPEEKCTSQRTPKTSSPKYKILTVFFNLSNYKNHEYYISC